MNSNETVQKSSKTFFTLYSGQVVSLFGSSISSFVIIWWITIQYSSAIFLAIGVLLAMLPTILLTPIAGVFVDRYSKKLIMGLSDFAQAVITLGVIIAFTMNIASIEIIFAMLFLKGITQAFHSPAFQSTLPILIPSEKLSQTNSLISLSNALVDIVAPVIAAATLSIWAIETILWIDLITFVFAIVPLLLISIPKIVPSKKSGNGKSSFKTEFKEGLMVIRSQKGLVPLLISFMFVNMTVAPIGVLLPLFVYYYHAGSALDFALISIMLQSGIILSSILFASKFKITRLMRSIIIGILGIFLGFILIGLTPQGQLWIIFIGLFILGILATLANIASQTLWQKAIPLELQGRTIGVRRTVSIASAPLGIILSSFLAEYIGVANVFVLLGFIGLTTVVLFLKFTSMSKAESSLELVEKEINIDNKSIPSI